MVGITIFAIAFLLMSVSSHAANGVMLYVLVHEELDANPPESALIDSVSFPVLYDRITTLLAGNFVLDVTAHPATGGSINLSSTVYVAGPVPFNKSDEANVQPGAALVVEGIRGKGKSSYRAILVPQPADVPDDTLAMTEDSVQWQSMISLRAEYFVPKGILPPLQFLPARSALDFELQTLMDTFAIAPAGRMLVYLAPGNLAGHPYEPEYGYSLDPARYRITAYNTAFDQKIRPRALTLLACYRAWGYAPQFLASGVAGYFGYADYDVVKDRDAGRAIPLDSLARTLDYKRHDRAVADHHAESFVTWLISTYGINEFKTLYERATDMSINRAVWSVYNQTLGELETKWIAFLKTRRVYSEECAHYAKRALAFRDFDTYLNLLQSAVAADAPSDDMYRDIGIAQGQLGRWSEATTTFARLIVDYPAEQTGRWLLAESQRASGDDVGAWVTYLDLLKRKPSDPQTFLRMGEIQWDARRVDSAAAFWRKGLASNPGPLTRGELSLRMAGYYQERRKGQDSARAYFADAGRSVAANISNSPTEATGWIISAEALLGMDSIALAVQHLAVAQAVSDAPIDLGRIHLVRGKCYDKLGERKDATLEYETAIAARASAPIARLAKKYLNRPFGR